MELWYLWVPFPLTVLKYGQIKGSHISSNIIVYWLLADVLMAFGQREQSTFEKIFTETKIPLLGWMKEIKNLINILINFEPGMNKNIFYNTK